MQVVMDEPCAVHFVGILQSRDASIPSSTQVYNYTGLNGISSDFNGTINVTQAGIPFSSGEVVLCLKHLSNNPVCFLFNMQFALV